MYVMIARKYEHITPVFRFHRRLPVSAGVGSASSRTRVSAAMPLTPEGTTHSADPCMIPPLRKHEPSPSPRRRGAMGFRSATPRLWNALPDHVRASQTVDSLKKKGLKTSLFSRSYDF